jgi:hypothetical protein
MDGFAHPMTYAVCMTASVPRFDRDAPDFEGASRYFERRAVQSLDRYFRLWLERLSVSRETFATLFKRLQVRPETVRLGG